MNKGKYPPNSYYGSTELKTTTEFIEECFNLILNGLVRPGLIIRKVDNGVLDTPFLVTGTNQDADSPSISVNGGVFIRQYGGVYRIIESKPASFAIDSATYQPGTYNISLVAGVSSYEKGTLTFTNASNSVTINNGNFNHLRPYGYIVVSDDTGASTAYKVIEVHNESVILENVYTGETKSNVKWKVGARFPVNATPQNANDMLLYEYDNSEIKISQKNLGIVLAEMTVLEGSTPGSISINVTDRRQSSVAVFNNNAANADDVIDGQYNRITTIEEKAQAQRLDRVVNDTFTRGIRKGYAAGDMVISGGNLVFGAIKAYDNTGKRIEIPAGTSINLDALLLNTGANYLYVYYKEPNSYDFTWNLPVPKGMHVFLAEVNKSETVGGGGGDASTYSPYTVTPGSYRSSIKSNSFISEGKILDTSASDIPSLDKLAWTEGEIFYNPLDKTYYYIKSVETQINANTKTGTTTVINYVAEKMVNLSYLTQTIDSLKHQERLRFALYPYANKKNWFLFNGIGAPCPVGYEFLIVEWKIGFFDTSLINDNYSIIDYMGGLQSQHSFDAKITSENGKWNAPLTKTKGLNNIDLSSTKYISNSTVGIFFNGTAGTRTIDLRVNGNNVDSVNMESEGFIPDGGGGTPINKLYIVEVTIQLTSGARIINTQQQNQNQNVS
ncbi:MAG: hypothetical protein EHM58_00535 [Ignavibacteriae bacterium]|nr:MAG: hypothetical protein EHM58_00535 [Ignavibacteriota bacterium]